MNTIHDILPNLLRKHGEPQRILEIGCNDGEDTVRFLDAFPQATVYCFEPDPRAVDRFLRNVRKNYGGRVWLSQTAVGATDGMVTFYPSMGLPHPLPQTEAERIAAKLPHGWDLSGSVRKPKMHLLHHPWCQFGEPRQVAMVRLDSWDALYMDGQIIDFLWADVQGAEVDLLQGGQNTLARTRYLYTEFSNYELYEGQINLRQLQSLLPGFRLVQKWNEDVLLENVSLV